MTTTMLDAQDATSAREAPALSFDVARRLGDDGGHDLLVATQTAFESGLRAAVLISAALFALAALYTHLRGQDPSPSTTTEPPDDDAAALAPSSELALEAI